MRVEPAVGSSVPSLCGDRVARPAATALLVSAGELLYQPLMSHVVEFGAQPRLIRPKAVIGPRLRFRNATPDDAEFILSLRLDADKNQFLSKVDDDVAKQRRWLASMDDDQIYFIIETEEPVGTVRLYDARGDSFCWGSWILNDRAPKSSAIESTLMVYALGLDLGFSASHFDVRKGNEHVWKYHERFGARRTEETELDYFYSISKEAIQEAFVRYESRLKPPIEILW